ncbi:hypothetical protein RHGRI_021639 [Rhododendron griersonianum]|uniref:Uncharacterized protein n=1 Tax=Rhododendron griersonianum TaxID=479676 RepID=A0AAV6JPD7_9ERIC|nr:hypothetical protein RHGRI_021639 [Rhododendron griersonianum]
MKSTPFLDGVLTGESFAFLSSVPCQSAGVLKGLLSMGLAGCLSGCFLSLAGHAPAETAHFQENDPVRFYGNVMLRARSLRDPYNGPFSFAGNSTVHG